MPVVKRIDTEITLKLGVMTFRPSHENNTIFPKTKKTAELEKISSAGFWVYQALASVFLPRNCSAVMRQ